MGEFKIPPISTLAGSTLTNYLKILAEDKISPKYFWKIFLTTLIIIISTPFQFWDFVIYHRRIKRFQFKKPPLFILGHWRSGTTLLHNILSKDPSAGFVSTYQSLFPNNLSSKWIFKTFMRLNMPDKRPTDNVKLDVDFPQEDEFAFSNCQPNAYYNFFYFPKKYTVFFKRAVLHKDLTEKEIANWYRMYDRLIKKALINTKGERLIIKNPVNTGRIDKILKLYPDAKFLFIYRNPYTVFLSTQKFFHQLFPTLWLNETTPEFIDNLIFDIYVELMELYEKQKKLIPPENLLEIRFEEFEKNPIEELNRIYHDLLREDFGLVVSHFKAYLNTQNNYKKNLYKVDFHAVMAIEKKWKKFINKYNYQIPKDIDIEAERL